MGPIETCCIVLKVQTQSMQRIGALLWARWSISVKMGGPGELITKNNERLLRKPYLDGP